MSDNSAPKFVFGKGGAGRIVPVDCKIDVPMEDGSVQTQILTARFEVLKDDDVTAFYGRDGGGEPALLHRALKGFVGFKDEDDQPVDDRAAMTELLPLPYVRLGLVRSYLAMLAGRLEKN